MRCVTSSEGRKAAAAVGEDGSEDERSGYEKVARPFEGQ
jgi:hypothetical protein